MVFVDKIEFFTFGWKKDVFDKNTLLLSIFGWLYTVVVKKSTTCPGGRIESIVDTSEFCMVTWYAVLDTWFSWSELLNCSRQHVDRTVFLNDQNCHWQSICSGEIVHSRFFSDWRNGFRSHLLVGVEFP